MCSTKDSTKLFKTYFTIYDGFLAMKWLYMKTIYEL